MWVYVSKCKANIYLHKYGTFQSEEKQSFVQFGIVNMNTWNFKHPIKNLTKYDQINNNIKIITKNFCNGKW
jgi:hypothetical protein